MTPLTSIPSPQSQDLWQRFAEEADSKTWPSLEVQMKSALSSTSSSRPFLSQREKRKVSFDTLPYLIDTADWQGITHGCRQRSILLNHVLSDLYGEQRCLQEGWIDLPELFSLKNYVLPSHGSTGMALPKLHFHHVQLARSNDGFVVLEDITSTPRQFGHVIEQRLIQNRLLASTQTKLNLQRLAPWFSQFKSHLYSSSPQHENHNFGVILSQGVDHDGYDEQAYLAHFFGFPIVESQDLVVRNQILYLKNLGYLQPITFVLRRVPENGLDPLEMKDFSSHSIPGLMGCLRHQNVFMDSIPGVGILEKKVIYDALPELCQYFLDEDLILPQVNAESFENHDWIPCFKDGKEYLDIFKLQLYISSFGDDQQVMPGGLALSMTPFDQGPVVKDLWVCGDLDKRDVEPTKKMIHRNQFRPSFNIPSRVADATLWFGRYIERSDCLCRILREVLVEPQREEGAREHSLRHLELIRTALEIPCDDQLVTWNDHWNSLTQDINTLGSLRSNLSAICRNALMLQDRISVDMLNISQCLTEPFSEGFSLMEAEAILTLTLEKIAAITGLSNDSMTHCDEWNFLIIGRRLERACTTLSILRNLVLSSERIDDHSWELLLRTFDSIMTYRRRYHIEVLPGAIFSMMTQDSTNPRSVSYQVNDMILTCKEMREQGALWAAEPAEMLNTILDSLSQLPAWPTSEDEPLEPLALALEQIQDQLTMFHQDLTRTLLHL